MPTYNAVQFGTYVYDTQNADPATWLDRFAVRPLLAPVPRSPRARTLTGEWAPRQVEIQGRLVAPAGSTLRAVMDDFLAAHTPGYRALYRDDDRYCEAEVRELSLGEQEGLSHCPYALRLEAKDPYLYSATESSVIWASVLNGATQEVTNGGTVPCAPTYAFTADATGTLTVTVTLGTDSFTLSTTVEAADILTVDALEQTCTRTRAGVTSNARGALTGSFFTIPTGEQTLTLTVDGASVALASLVMTWRNRWL